MGEGIVFKALSGFYYVDTDEGIVECKARGRFRLEKNSPYVGDRVEFTPTEPNKGFLTKIFPRKNFFVRPPVTNIDNLVIIASAAVPVTDIFLIDKMTAVAKKNDCEAIICLNKCDLDPADTLFNIYSNSGFQTIRTSAKTGEGIDDLLMMISGSISAFTGNSGVGKSSILNCLDASFDISVGEISKKLGRGRHTTRHTELFRLPYGAVIADTPGFSAFDIDGIVPKDKIRDLFHEFSEYSDNCRFHDCAHIKEPDCAVLEAIDNGLVEKTRHSSYIRMFEQAKEYYPTR